MNLNFKLIKIPVSINLGNLLAIACRSVLFLLSHLLKKKIFPKAGLLESYEVRSFITFFILDIR